MNYRVEVIINGRKFIHEYASASEAYFICGDIIQKIGEVLDSVCIWHNYDLIFDCEG